MADEVCREAVIDLGTAVRTLSVALRASERRLDLLEGVRMGGGSTELKTLKAGIDGLSGIVFDLRHELRQLESRVRKHQAALELLQGQLAKPAVGPKAPGRSMAKAKGVKRGSRKR